MVASQSSLRMETGMVPQWDNLSDPIFHHAAERPVQPAVIDGPDILTYSEFAALVGQACVWLRGLGIGAGDRIGVSMTNRADHLILLFAVLRIGAQLTEIPSSTPLDPAVLDRLHIDRLFVEPNAAPVSIPATKVDTNWRDGIARLRGDYRHQTASDGIATVALSSGSTGMPKGVAVTHQQFFARYQVYLEMFAASGAHAFGNATPFLLVGSLSSIGFFKHIICQIAAGGATVLLPIFRHPMDLTRAVLARGEAVLTATANMCRVFIACAPAEGLLFPRLRTLISVGQPLFAGEKLAILERVTPNFYDNYGAAGIGAIACLNPDDVREKAASVGRPVPGMEIEIVDLNGARLPSGAIGHLRCRSITAASGLVGHQGGLDEGFVDGGYYPGEIGSLDADGYLYLAGRSAEMIRRGGIEIFPPEIEAVFSAHPAVRDVAVIGRKAANGAEEIVAFVVVQGNLSREDLMQHCTSRLPRERWPDRVGILDALPKLADGKTDRARLRSAPIQPPSQRTH
jgi:acyl-CoA synthetase (AMP-forming)/AMP-acid ligase II